MKIPLQEKIAELESRIAGLELRATVLETNSRRRVTRTTVVTGDAAEFHSHWREMWRHFDLAVKSFFKVEP